MANFMEWWGSLGGITKYTTLLSLILAVGVPLGLWTPWHLLMDQYAIKNKYEYWRFITTIFYIGPIGFTFLFNLIFWVVYQQKFEDEVFPGRCADHVWMLLVLWSLSVLGGWGLAISHLHDVFMMAMVWVSCKMNENSEVQILGLKMQAPWFPYFLFALHFFQGGNPVHDVVGILSGHVFWFFSEFLPRTHAKNLLRTPTLLYKIFPPSSYNRFRGAGGGRAVGQQ